MSSQNQKDVYISLGYVTALAYDEGKTINFEQINSVAKRKYPKKIVVRLDNTAQLNTTNILKFEKNVDFHIVGGYNNARVERFGKSTYENGETGAYLTSAVIYQRGELQKILSKIEMLEKGIKKEWSHLQILIYLYEQIQREIIYDPKFEYKLSRDVSSLRGLITNQSVCAGFSLILKELLDRNGVPCEYVEGLTNTGGGHAWNIVTIDGKKYGIDLTWDTRTFLTTGRGTVVKWLTNTPDDFARTHRPYNIEPTQNYRTTLSKLPLNLVTAIRDKIRVERNCKTNIYHGTRTDGSKFIVSPIGISQTSIGTYYNYFYQPIYSNGERGPISILYGKYNIAKLLDDIVWNRNYKRQEKFAVDNVLFSEANIKNSCYVGNIYITNGALAKSPSDIIKTPQESLFFYGIQTRLFVRRDNSQFFVRENDNVKYFQSKGRKLPIHSYIIVERLYERGEEVIKMNNVYTEMDLIKDSRNYLIANFLTRPYLEKCMRNGGGYIGYLDNNGDVIIHPYVAQNFNVATRIDSNSYNTL